jgi:Ca-activated chloride channel family protein
MVCNMKKTFLNIVWASSENWYVFIGLILITLVAWFSFYKKRALVEQLVKPQWQKIILKHYSEWRIILRLVLWVLAFFAVCCALLQPQWGKKDEVVGQEGRELFIALDVSRSMLAEDVKPSRLAFAQSKIKRLLQLLSSERVGLIVFAGVPIVQCPLTRDTALFSMFLNQVDADTISTGTTALDQVITKTVTTFQRMATRKNKILVIFTDGEDFSQQLSQVRQKASEAGLHVFTYGVGTEQGAPVPVLKEGKTVGFEKNEQGNVVLTKLNEGILRSLSSETGAQYISPTQTDDDLLLLVKKVEEYEKESFEDRQLSVYEDRYPFFLVVSLCALLLEWLL